MKRLTTFASLLILSASATVAAAPTMPAAPANLPAVMGHPMPWSPEWIVVERARLAFLEAGRAGNPGFEIESQTVAMDVDLDGSGFTSDVTVSVRSTQSASPTFYFYVMDPALVQSITANGAPTTFVIDQGVLMLKDLGLTKDAPTEVVIHLAGGLTCGGSSVYEDVCNFAAKVKYFFAYGWARPVFYDWAGTTIYVPGTVSVAIPAAHADLIGVSDGVHQGRQTMADRVVDTYAFDAGRISYQFLWGHFQTFQQDWEGVDVACVLDESHAAYGPACVSTVKDVLDFHSGHFSKYPYPRLKVIDAGSILAGGYGAPMNIVLHSHVLDSFDYVFAGVVSHEIGHQWWGGIVSFDLAGGIPATEGLAEFSASLYQEQRGIYDHAWGRHAANTLYIASAAGDVPLSSPSINYAGGSAMTSLIYDKSPAAFHAFHRVLGDDVFFGALRSMVLESPGSRTYKDLFDAFVAQGASQDVVDTAIRPWFESAGHPVLDVRLVAGEDGAMQATWSRSGMAAPIAFRLPVSYDFGTAASAGTSFADIAAAASGTCPAGFDALPSYVELDAERGVPVALVPSAAGDANRDGVVDGFDLLMLARYSGTSAIAGEGFANPLYSDGPDFDGDRDIGDKDLDVLKAGFGKVVP